MLANSLLVAFCVVIITFFLIRYLLGDPAYQYAMAQNGGNAPAPASVEAARIHLGLTSSTAEQLGHYLLGLLHGDLGTSFQGAQLPVGQLVWGGFCVTLLLTGLAMAMSTVAGAAIGLWLANVRVRLIDTWARLGVMVGIAAPAALVGLLLVWLASVVPGVLPAGGWGQGYPSNFRYLVLPVLALCVGLVPAIVRVVRERGRAVLDEPHIDAARTRGISPAQLLIRHVLPECAAPLVRFLALNTAWLLSGAVVVETAFGIPGIGRTLENAVNADDFPVIQACAMLTGFLVVICFAIAQVVSRLIDPRTRG
jgi:peptide/nickel transport system permease protein